MILLPLLFGWKVLWQPRAVTPVKKLNTSGPEAWSYR
jgi:hypothetical protein